MDPLGGLAPCAYTFPLIQYQLVQANDISIVLYMVYGCLTVYGSVQGERAGGVQGRAVTGDHAYTQQLRQLSANKCQPSLCCRIPTSARMHATAVSRRDGEGGL